MKGNDSIMGETRRLTPFGRWAALVAMMTLAGLAPAADSPRQRLLLDFGWRFHLGDDWGTCERPVNAGVSTGPAKMNFNDSEWRSLDLPHDWAVELPFDPNADHAHGNKPLGPGFPTNSVGWYRRKFMLPDDDQGKRLCLEFDGVYRDCRVFLNGFRLARHESGYGSFRCDITDVVHYGDTNVLAVRVDASQFEGWFYEGAGIYRHTWLLKTASLAIVPDGTFVYSAFPNDRPNEVAQIHVETRLHNAQERTTDARVNLEIVDPTGKIIATAYSTAKLEPDSVQPITQITPIAGPMLWSPESPRLYKLIATVESGGAVVDRVETEFGIRTLAFDPERGFLLNGALYPIKGTCNHQDHAGVGSALPDALQFFRVAKLKEMGCNAIRTSHHPPTPELLQACDQLGLLVMDENRVLGSDAQNLANLEAQVRRDRNHPCVFIWSLCNEEPIQRSPAARRIADTMQRLVHRLDPTRLCTAAMNSWSDHRPDGISAVIDVQGFNYFHSGDMDLFHKSNPAKPCIGTEEASTFYTRGVYENTKTYKSAYGATPSYDSSAEEWWNYYAARPWASGSFVWTGFDYRGEPSPFGWPNISSEYGILDTCGFPKDVFYYYQSWWSGKTVLHLMPHWTWPGKEGQPIDVRCFSNCEEVELFLNGQSLGKKAMPKNSHLQWFVKYAPGTLSAKGYKADQLVAEDNVETTGAPATIKLKPDRVTLVADGQDLSLVTVAVTDAQGRLVPAASNLVSFELDGPGKIIGVGNGDPACHEPDVYPSQAPLRMISLDDWRMKEVPDARALPVLAGDSYSSGWTKVDVRAETGPLKQDQSAVFRTHFLLTTEDLAATNALLHFGMIDDEGWVYVNGKLAGESHDWESDPSFEIRKFLHTGDNTIAVAVKNDENEGGVNKGVTLEFEEKTVVACWQRSLFNGLAQVIVQAGQSAGQIQLRARAEGLAPASTLIRAAP